MANDFLLIHSEFDVACKDIQNKGE
jgi:hypothetical protein